MSIILLKAFLTKSLGCLKRLYQNEMIQLALKDEWGNRTFLHTQSKLDKRRAVVKGTLELDLWFARRVKSLTGEVVHKGYFPEDEIGVTPQQLMEKLMITAGHTGGISSVSKIEGTRRIVSGSHDNTLRVWALESVCRS
jgi:WD40 repeat protein